jgi:predicted permease
MTRIAAWFRRPRLDRELEKELQFHLDQHVQDLVDAGMSPDAARRQARIELGGVDQVKQRVRDSRSGAWLDRLRCDSRDALRGIGRAPGIALTAIVLIALVIGGNTTIFSAVNGILRKPARGVQATRLVTLQSQVDGQPPRPNHSYPDYLDYVSASTSVRPLLGYAFERFTITLPNGSYAVRGGMVTSNYFEALGVDLVRGRSFSSQESGLDASGLVAVIGYRFWQEQLGGKEEAIGQPVALNGHPATVIGVAPPEFQGAWLADSAQVWVPLLAYARIDEQDEELSDRSSGPILAIGRLADGASLSTAQAEFATISSRLAAAYPDTNRGKSVTLVRYSVTAGGDSFVNQQQSMFLAIFAAITLLTVVIVCANVANLMLARAAVRQRETAVRRSLGATELGIVRTLLIEGLIISLAAWLVACLFAWWTSGVLIRLVPPAAQGSAIPIDFTPDWRVMIFAMGLALLATVAFTLPPAVRAWHQDVLPWLKAGEQGVIQGRARLSSALVIVQLALAVLLLTGAGLAFRSTSLITGRSLGFETANLVLTTITTNGVATSEETNRALLERVRERLRSAPGVRSVSFARSVPSMPDRRWREDPVRIRTDQEPRRTWVNVVGPEYLRVLGLSPVAGRELGADDDRQIRTVAMINEDLANALWPGQSAVGQTLILRPGQPPAEIVSVAPNVLFGGYATQTRPNFVFLSQQHEPAPPGEMTFYIRHTGTLDAVAPAIGRALRDVDSRIPIVYTRTLDTELNTNTWHVRFISTLLVVFAMGSLLIAAIGQYAVIAFDMRRRTRDFGIRIALGASTRRLVSEAIQEGLRWTATGLLFGFGLSLAAGRAFRSLLFGITPTDTATYVGVFIVLGGTSLLACYLPSRRVTRIDPMQALRQD